ncbi:MAG: WxL domain-containing protein [Actinobacteria bacterium]|nr:WxL domain-containing protein [Actinomycetota bacterium]
MRSFITGSNSTNTGIDFGSLTSPNKPTPIAGDLNRIQVVDQRYGAYGWSLTATMSNFVGAAVSMNKSTVSLSPSCVAVGANSAPGLTAGGASQSFASPVALCAKDTQAGTSGNTSGAYNVDASVVLTIPAFQRADVYSAIITITLA